MVSKENHEKTAGIYVHIPFCLRKCPYCDFYSITDISLEQLFFDSVYREIVMRSNTSFLFDTIYIGGGTPSVVAPENIGRLIEKLHHYYKISPEAQITIEVNPVLVDFKLLSKYLSYGINRLSIGIQSFGDENLTFLGRIHSASEGIKSITDAKEAGFNNISLDLIYGIPGQTMEDWLLDLSQAVAFKPEHISCYMLTYEKDTPMEKRMREGEFQPLPEELAGNYFSAANDFLNSNGYSQYEISNFARTGSDDLRSLKSRHNFKYWSFSPYIGFGPSAHSFSGDERSWNHGNVLKYAEDIKSDILPVADTEVLNREQKILEAVYLGLRKTEGIDLKEFKNKFGVSFREMFINILPELIENKHLEVSKNRCALTSKGMLFHDSIVSMLVDEDI